MLLGDGFRICLFSTLGDEIGPSDYCSSGCFENTNQAGSLLWGFQGGTASEDQGHSLAVDSDDSVVAAGWTGGGRFDTMADPFVLTLGLVLLIR